MEKSEISDKVTSILFYIFIGQVVLGMAAVLGYILYSFIFG